MIFISVRHTWERTWLARTGRRSTGIFLSIKSIYIHLFGISHLHGYSAVLKLMTLGEYNGWNHGLYWPNDCTCRSQFSLSFPPPKPSPDTKAIIILLIIFLQSITAGSMPLSLPCWKVSAIFCHLVFRGYMRGYNIHQKTHFVIWQDPKTPKKAWKFSTVPHLVYWWYKYSGEKLVVGKKSKYCPCKLRFYKKSQMR